MRDKEVNQDRGGHRETSLNWSTGEPAEAVYDSLERAELRGCWTVESHVRVISVDSGHVVGDGVGGLDPAAHDETCGVHGEVPPSDWTTGDFGELAVPEP